jgi:hypothetical protein
MPFTAPQEAAVVMAANRPMAAMPKRTSLPSMLPPDCVLTRLVGRPVRQPRIALLLGGRDGDHGDDEHHRHRRQHGPALAQSPTIRPKA